LEKLLPERPEQLGYKTPLWSCPRVAQLIEQEFGVRYHEGHVWKILAGIRSDPPDAPANAARGRSSLEKTHLAAP